nr:LOW QUALITY PROTEIN: SLIT-ROBO Rho GTPase-activating protein 2-like [Salvelinus alpinus]
MKVLNELYTVMKTYHMYNTDSISSENKLKDAEKQEEKQMGRFGRQDDRQTPRSPDTLASVKTEEKHVRRSSVKKIEKMKEKRQAKYTENKLKAVKARNEYLLALEATNSCVFKYYIHDLSDIIDCCDLGYHASLHRALRTYLSAEMNVEASKHSGLEGLERAVESLEPNGDKQRLMETYNNVFCPPMRFDFQSHMGDTMGVVCAQQPLEGELLQRCQQLQSRLSTLTIENEEVKKTMEATLSTIQDMVTVEDYDVSECFHHSNSMESVKSTMSPREDQRQEELCTTEAGCLAQVIPLMGGELYPLHQSPMLTMRGIFKSVWLSELEEAWTTPSSPRKSSNDLKYPALMENLQERAVHIRKVLLSLPSNTLIIMRYLFALLNYLSRYSEDNMMDPYNLAICFGPTLMSVPESCDQVSCQAHVNELIKTIIIHHDGVFPGPRNLQGPVYISPGATDEYCDPHCEPPLVDIPAPDTISVIHNSDDGEYTAICTHTHTRLEDNLFFREVGPPEVWKGGSTNQYRPVQTNIEKMRERSSSWLGCSLMCVCSRPDGGRGSPKTEAELQEERVSTRGTAASPTGAHVADIYLANLNKMRKRPELGSIRRTFWGSEGVQGGDVSLSGATGGGVRTASLPVGGALVKEGGDKRPVSAHSVLNSSITRHSSLKTKVESPQFCKATTTGRSKSFSNHRPLDPEVIAQMEPTSQDIEAAMSSALSELKELERQSSVKHTHTPDVVLDTLEQLKGVCGGGGASEPSSPLHSRLLRDSEGAGSPHSHPLQRSASSASDVPSSFRPSKPRSPLPSSASSSLASSALAFSTPSFREPRPPATRPKPVVFPKGGGGGSPAMGSPTTTVPPTPPTLHPTPANDKSCPA